MLSHLPIVIMAGVSVVIALAMYTLTSLLGPKKMTEEKAVPYESGGDSTGAKGIKLNVKFYLTAMLFVVFDVEAVFLYPWGALFRSLGWLGLVEMAAFLGILGVTLVYAWKKGALEWQK